MIERMSKASEDTNVEELSSAGIYRMKNGKAVD